MVHGELRLRQILGLRLHIKGHSLVLVLWTQVSHLLLLLMLLLLLLVSLSIALHHLHLLSLHRAIRSEVDSGLQIVLVDEMSLVHLLLVLRTIMRIALAQLLAAS